MLAILYIIIIAREDRDPRHMLDVDRHRRLKTLWANLVTEYSEKRKAKLIGKSDVIFAIASFRVDDGSPPSVLLFARPSEATAAWGRWPPKQTYILFAPTSLGAPVLPPYNGCVLRACVDAFIEPRRTPPRPLSDATVGPFESCSEDY